jgi:hypothetical protein
MDRKTRSKLRLLRSKKFSAPAAVGLKQDSSGALRVGKNQIHDANQFAQSVGCGSPFGADGKPVMDRATKKKYMQELNRRRVDQGESRYVNFDGGYGDET